MQEGVKLYGQLPDYGDFQCYDLGKGDILLHVDLRMYGNFDKPSWQTLKHHLSAAKITKKLFKGIKELPRSDKRVSLRKKERLGVAKIPIVNTFSELVEVDFCRL